VVLAWSSLASAQGVQTSGLFGNRTLGGGVSGGGRSAFGTPGGNRMEQFQSGAGEVRGNERFVRGNRQPGEFVGADTRDTTNFLSALTSGQLGNLRGGSPLGATQPGRSGQGVGGRAGGTGGRSRITYRAALRVEFEYPKPAAAEVSQRIQQRLAKTSQIRSLVPLSVTIQDRIATLRGAVATDHDRELAGRLAALEPGVSAVENLVTVGPLPDLSDPAPRPPSP